MMITSAEGPGVPKNSHYLSEFLGWVRGPGTRAYTQ